MQVETIKMDQAAAKKKLWAAMRQIKRYRNPDPKLLALRDGYQALARGTPVILLGPSIARGGWDEKGRPRLAVARSDRPRVTFTFSGAWPDRRSWIHFDSDYGSVEGGWRSVDSKTLRKSFPTRLFPPMPEPEISRRSVAIVPLVPPDVLETAGNPSLAKCFTLFEADWTEVPVDPMLLRSLGGDLYAVLAHWDLTELERAVLAETVVE